MSRHRVIAAHDQVPPVTEIGDSRAGLPAVGLEGVNDGDGFHESEAARHGRARASEPPPVR